ncbi:MAG: SdpI family protein [Nanoarchaeota archaeon]|nr:SdpI family protein [Nanoarchaeota archaeon]MBU1322008.1 SdpI family protein [Nanoarchaeota archaeon]MBU1598093.1 SdpI family protein [Nanoarchaeota archaeon]MBU2441778.1 SdpI family protein [Nanoarchaeota archaeon]
MKKAYFAMIIIILVSILISFWAYPKLPEETASHWNAKGEVDDYMPRFWGAFLMPVVSIGLFILFLVIPIIDPLKFNIEKFRKYFDWFIIIIFVFLFYIHMLTLSWGLGIRFNMSHMITPAIGLLFLYAGLLVSKAKRNWFIGIRTPWTLSSDKVWDKTHQLGGKLFMAAGIIAILSVLFPKISIWLVIVPILAVVIFTVIYSYILYRKEEKNKTRLKK